MENSSSAPNLDKSKIVHITGKTEEIPTGSVARMLAALYARGASLPEIALTSGYSVERLELITRQDWFRRMVLEFGSPMTINPRRLAAAVPAAIERLVVLSNSKNDATSLAAVKEILVRGLGVPGGKSRPAADLEDESEDPAEEMQNIEQELRTSKQHES